MSDRVTIRKRNGQWQIRHKGETVREYPTHEEAVKYVATQVKMRAALKAFGGKLITTYMKGKTG